MKIVTLQFFCNLQSDNITKDIRVKGVAYTVGNYKPRTQGGFIGTAYIFKPGHGTADHHSLNFIAMNEKDIQDRIIAHATPLILRYYSEPCYGICGEKE